MMRLLASGLFAVLAGCASVGASNVGGAGSPGTAVLPPLDAAEARLVFLRSRESLLYLARRAPVYVAGEKTGSAPFGGYFHRDVGPGEIRLTVKTWDMPGRCEVVVNTQSGKTYYLQVDPRDASFGAFLGGSALGELLGQDIWVSLVGGLVAQGVESYARDCGGLFRLYPVDDVAAQAALATLKRVEG